MLIKTHLLRCLPLAAHCGVQQSTPHSGLGRRLVSGIFLNILLIVLSCSSAPNPAEKVARQFMESYYVTADLKGAERLADGLALERVRSSLSLTEGQSIDESTRQPRVTWKLLEGGEKDQEAEYFYRVVIELRDFPKITKRSRIKLRERPLQGAEGGWKVTQFSDQDEK